MIEVHDGKIEKFVEQNRIDVVVNAARPSLMGAHSAGSEIMRYIKLLMKKREAQAILRRKLKKSLKKKFIRKRRM